ncbi:glycosyltransferase family 2 protein [Gottfriedia acidiceleris]|uniref:glycosyltransferase family 2 protein n=1 Tax=Gottfriedia acidiceleris TaxID=371036 RepID=UPI000B4543D8|nr:glycosyltransferase [Gottfriedia acidiceleris]
MPLISVIIPVYNVEKYISTCLDSVLAQSMIDFEVLLINDGSTDRSAVICDKYSNKDKRVKVYHKENSGPSSARNLGIKKASGEYIMFIDADDYIDQDTFRIVNFEAEKFGADIVVFPIFEKKGEVIQIYNIAESYFDDEESKKGFLKEVWLKSGLLASPVNKIYKAEVIKNNNILFNEDFCIAEDYLFNMEYIDAARKGCSIKTPLYYYVRHNDSISTKVFYNKFDIALAVYRESLGLLSKYSIKEVEYINKIHTEFATGLIRAMYEATRRGYKRNFFKKLKEIKKCMTSKETRSLFTGTLDFSTFNNFVIFCLRYKQSFIFYLVFKLKNLFFE